MSTIRQLERRLAVTANWSVAGAFGIGAIQSGLRGDDIVFGLLGFAIIAVGFVSQVIINHFFGDGFTRGEVALSITVFGVSVLGFIFSWLFDPGFSTVDVMIGISGFATIIACFLIYLVAKYGLKGSFSMFHGTGGR